MMVTDNCSLAGKSAVVTGAGNGIGRAISLAFAEAGAAVACVDLDAKAAEATAAAIANKGWRISARALRRGQRDRSRTRGEKNCR
jgi:Dehydrogenases with different specificities (related to short-chain alcohol dehydrogenases)